MLERRFVVAVKQEATPGTAEAAPAVLACNIYDAVMNPQIENTPSESLAGGGGGAVKSVPAARGAECTFWVDLAGSGAALTPTPEWFSTLMPACNYTNTSEEIWDPELRHPEDAGGSTKTLTIWLYEDGKIKKMHGAMGTATFPLASGARGKVEFSFTGCWDTPADGVIIAPGAQTANALRFASAALTIGLVTPRLANLTIDLGNEVVLRESQETATGYYAAAIVDMLQTMTLDPEAVLVATDPRQADWLAQTEQAFSMVLGSVAGNILTVTAPKFQITNIQDERRNKIKADSVTAQLNRSGAGGDDALRFVWS